MANVPQEILHSENATKQIYWYHDDTKKIKQLSREVFKKDDKVIHYPRGFDSPHKYRTIRKFIYIGFKTKLPVGVFKSVNFGYGFIKKLKPFAQFIDKKFDFEEVIIEKGGKVLIDKKHRKLFLSEIALAKVFSALDTTFKKNKADVTLVLDTTLHSIFPKDFVKPTKTYTANALASALDSWGNSIDEFSDNDKNAIQELFDKLSLNTTFLNDQALAKTKQIIDNKYLQKTIVKFKSLMKTKVANESAEKKWQALLRDNSWIFSSIFSQPVILYKDEAFVGGKTINNRNGKVSDFLIKNSLSDNVSFLEIKTNKTALLEKVKVYRGTDVFSMTKFLSGSIVQVLNQRDNFQKEFYAMSHKSLKSLKPADAEKVKFETFNSKCVVLIGTLGDLSKEELYAFELFRSNSRDVEIITFDELQRKIESLQELLKK